MLAYKLSHCICSLLLDESKEHNRASKLLISLMRSDHVKESSLIQPHPISKLKRLLVVDTGRVVEEDGEARKKRRIDTIEKLGSITVPPLNRVRLIVSVC